MKQFEVVIPVEWGKEVFDKALSVIVDKSREYVWAKHPVDELSSFEHWHIGCTLHSSRTLDDVLKWFRDAGLNWEKNTIEKIRSHFKTYVVYVLHLTEDAIKQGKSKPVEYGGNVDFEKILKDYESRGKCDTIVRDILDGKMPEYMFYSDMELVNAVIEQGLMTKVKQAFESADKNRLVRSTTMSEERKQCWIFGKAGSGKSELAKWYCRNLGYKDTDIYVTSSGQNPFDDYRGQPCIVVDDIDAETMTPKTALKLADCFTGSAVKARYSNKVLYARVVVFTSTVSPSSWWKGLANDKVDGNVYQLLRRLNYGTWHIDDSFIEMTLYDGQGEMANRTRLEMPKEVIEKVKSKRTDTTLNELVGIFRMQSEDSNGNQLTMDLDATTGEIKGFITKGGK